MAQSQRLGLPEWEGKVEQSARQAAERTCVCGLFPFSSFIQPGPPSYMVAPLTLMDGSPPLLLMESPSWTHPEACFMNRLGLDSRKEHLILICWGPLPSSLSPCFWEDSNGDGSSCKNITHWTGRTKSVLSSLVKGPYFLLYLRA